MFAGLFGSNTPPYKGSGQSTTQSRGGVFGLITGLFASSSPSYVRPQAAPERVPESPAGESPAAPIGTAKAPSPNGDTEDGPNGEPEPLGRPITIIVKPGPGTTVEQVVQFLQDRCLDD